MTAGTGRSRRAAPPPTMARRIWSLWSDAALDEIEPDDGPRAGSDPDTARRTARSATSSAARHPTSRPEAEAPSGRRKLTRGSAPADPGPARRSGTRSPGRSSASSTTGTRTTGRSSGTPARATGRGSAGSEAASRRAPAARDRNQGTRPPAARDRGTAATGRAPATGRSRPAPVDGSLRSAARRRPAPSAGTSRTPTARRSEAAPDDRDGPARTSRSRSTGRSGAAAPARTRSGTGTVRTSRSGRSATGRSGTARTPVRTARRPNDLLVSGFRPRRRGDDDATGRTGRTRADRGGRTPDRSRRRHPPVTEIGERNAAYLTVTVLGLTLFGLVMVLSASSVSSLHALAHSPFFQFKRQLIWAGIGAVAFVVASRVDYRRLRPLAGPLMGVTIVLLLALFIPGLGLSENGSTRWLGIGPFVIQPSELAKLALILYVADLLARRERRMDRPELTVRPVMLLLGLLSALIVAQPKLGTPIIMAAVVILMLFIAGARMRSLLSWVSVAVTGTLILAYLAPYRRQRLLAFMNPWQDPLGIGLQSIQSQVGIASGGLFGVGLGASRAKWGFLPFAHTDFIFAIVAEEVGLVGASALIGGFLLLAWLGLRTALAAPDRFGTLLAAGITSWLLVQAFMNIGMVLGVLPITGEALPFVSAGGSSLVVTLAAAGLLTSVSRRSRA